jgi:hypothetical protein
MLDPRLLRQARATLSKEAFAPLTPEASGAAQQPAGMPGMPPGMPPMDPAMAGGVPPGAPPMDPAMMGGAPPMDPAMMGGAPPPPMDPAMMGGAPPMDPAAGGAMPPLTVSGEELMTLFQEIAKQSPGGDSSSGRVTNREIKEQLDSLSEQIGMLAGALGVQLPVAQVGAGVAPGLPAGDPAQLAGMMPPPAEMPKAAKLAPNTPMMRAIGMLKRNR